MADRATVLTRVEQVLALRLTGADLTEIRRFASAQVPPWNVSDRQLERYCQASDKLLEERLDLDRKRLLRLHVARRRALYSKCMASRDFTNARLVMADEAELLHLYTPAPATPEAADNNPVKTAELVKVLSARLRQLEREDLPATERTRLTASLADAIVRALNADELEERLKVVEKALAEQTRNRA
jgi:hypothetical protein